MAEDTAIVPQNSNASTIEDNAKSVMSQSLLTLPPVDGGLEQAQLAWIQCCEALENWVYWNLLNRNDVYGQYLSLDARHGSSKNFTAPADEDRRFPGALTSARIKQHFCGLDRGHLIGIHAISPQNASRWFAIDIDQHCEDGALAALANLRAAEHWYMVLTDLGFHPLLMDSNGNGGLHVWVILREPVPTWVVYQFAQWLVGDYREYGLTDVPETFPKQACLSETCKYGNWLRLPGLHHSRDHWTKVWAHGQWLTGESAINHFVQATGDDVRILREWLTSPPLPIQPQRQPGPTARISVTRRPSPRCIPNRGDSTHPVVISPQLSQKTRRFLLGHFQNEPRWNQRLFAAACDMAGNGFSFDEALLQLLRGAGPYDDHEREVATRTVRSAFSKDRHAAKSFPHDLSLGHVVTVGDIIVATESPAAVRDAGRKEN